MIPNTIHFIFGMNKDFGGKPFSFIHYMAVYTAWKINRPDKILFHYAFEPDGYWWEQARPFLTLNQVEAPDTIFGNPIKYYAHKADVVRLEVLSKYGGIYLDLDVICINSFRPLLQHDCVLGIEPSDRHGSGGLSNAVILSKADSEFLSTWYGRYKDFDGRSHIGHSVKLPWMLANDHSSLIHIEDEYSFCYPFASDHTATHHFWFSSFPLRLRLLLVSKALVARALAGKGRGNTRPAPLRLAHVMHTKRWHHAKHSKSFCVHLWEARWWEPYLKHLSPEYILNESSNFAVLMRSIIGREELLAMCKWNG
ncbi:MAG: glycosyltransferase [Actinomycetota bacterium]|nr:glycosyltransferase [Actinomycetota bacterium]